MKPETIRGFVGAVVGILVMLLVLAFFEVVLAVAPPKLTPECDHDGRCHPCNVITENGVTEHLGDYKERCGG